MDQEKKKKKRTEVETKLSCRVGKACNPEDLLEEGLVQGEAEGGL